MKQVCSLERLHAPLLFHASGLLAGSRAPSFPSFPLAAAGGHRARPTEPTGAEPPLWCRRPIRRGHAGDAHRMPLPPHTALSLEGGVGLEGEVELGGHTSQQRTHLGSLLFPISLHLLWGGVYICVSVCASVISHSRESPSRRKCRASS